MSPLRKLSFVPKKFEYKNKEIGWKEYLQFESFYERNISELVSQNMKFKDISVDNNRVGKPFLKVTGSTLNVVKQILKKKKI